MEHDDLTANRGYRRTEEAMLERGPGADHDWIPPWEWARLQTVDVHTAGEPLRIITGGVPDLPGSTILERRRWLRERLDSVRTVLMWEPRGHREMYGCIITPPVEEGSDFGVLFLHNEGYSTMCGHGIIGIATAAPHLGLVEPVEPGVKMQIDTPAGRVTAFARIENGRVSRVRFRNVPSFVDALGEVVEVPGLGEVRYDLAFGGAYYAFVQAADLDLRCTPDEHDRLIATGMTIKRVVMENRPIEHPREPDLGYLYGTIFIAPPLSPGVDSRNVCIFADGQVDRSPTGTGVSARMAIHHARGEIGTGEDHVVESITGTTFTGRVAEVTEFGGRTAVIPEVEGSAHITGRHEFIVDPEDPLGEGFFLG